MDMIFESNGFKKEIEFKKLWSREPYDGQRVYILYADGGPYEKSDFFGIFSSPQKALEYVVDHFELLNHYDSTQYYYRKKRDPSERPCAYNMSIKEYTLDKTFYLSEHF